MTRQDKARIIEDLVDQFKNHEHVYFTDASGLTVAQVNNLRRLCHGRGIKYGVYKNTLIRKALDNLDTQADYSEFTDQVLVGFTGIMFMTENSKLPAQTIKEFRKASNTGKPLLKGASIDTDLFIGEDKLDMLSKLKTREELIGEVITLLQSPMTRLLGQLTSGRNTLAGIVKTLSEREG
jgi:large subunit ribosomal protein L10